MVRNPLPTSSTSSRTRPSRTSGQQPRRHNHCTATHSHRNRPRWTNPDRRVRRPYLPHLRRRPAAGRDRPHDHQTHRSIQGPQTRTPVSASPGARIRYLALIVMPGVELRYRAVLAVLSGDRVIEVAHRLGVPPQSPRSCMGSAARSFSGRASDRPGGSAFGCRPGFARPSTGRPELGSRTPTAPGERPAR
jgi:hypothetical protein